MFSRLKKIHKKFFKKPSLAAGFLILEILVATYVISMGLIGSLSLITYIAAKASVSSSRLVAANLAQEGLEVVHNIRDSQALWRNWFDNPPVGFWRVQYNTTQLDKSDWDTFLLYDPSTHLYQYDNGSPTSFKRKITLSKTANDVQIQVIAEVSWTEKGKSYSLTVDSRLWNWK